jgi:hypothetical protein
MASGRLYLVRRDGREFIGPMLLHEFQQRLARLEFGLQDEVSGHCGPWVVLDQKEILTLHYPEIASLLQDALPLSWREVTGHAKVISRQDQRRDRQKLARSSRTANHNAQTEDFNAYLRQRRQQKQLLWGAALLVVFVLLMTGFWWTGRKDDVPSLAEMNALANRLDPGEFLNVMGLRVVPQAAKLVKNAKTQATWMPYLRMYAFFTNGTIDGVSAKLLRGDLPPNAPTDCSVDFLKRKWRENAGQVALFSQGRSLSKNPWTKILAMDPNWVKRRPAKGWLKPRNYYEGCLIAASTAIRSLSGEPGLGADGKDGLTPEVMGWVSRRLQAQMDLVNFGKTNVPLDQSNLLGSLTCFDNVQFSADIEACKGRFDSQLQPLIDERTALALVRIAVNVKGGAVDANGLGLLRQSASKIMPEDVMSRADLAAESQLIGLLLSGSAVEQAISKTQSDHQDVVFR